MPPPPAESEQQLAPKSILSSKNLKSLTDGPQKRSLSPQSERNRLEELERELELQRRALREEKERQQKLKTAEFKQRLREEQLQREREARGDFSDSNTATASVPAKYEEPRLRQSPKPRSTTPPTTVVRSKPVLPDLTDDLLDDDEGWKEREKEFNRLRKEREMRKEKEREEKEAKLRAQISGWMGSVPQHTAVTTEVTKQLSALQSYIEKISKPSPPPETLMGTSSPKRRLSAPQATPANGDVDFEVEARLLQVERDVMQEVHEELSNAEKAAIAEKRARAMIEAYHARTSKSAGSRGGGGNLNGRRGNSANGPRPEPKPSYTPKLNRLRRLPGADQVL